MKLVLTPLIDPRTAVQKTINQNSYPINTNIYHVPQIVPDCTYNKWKEEIGQDFCQIGYVCSDIQQLGYPSYQMKKTTIFATNTLCRQQALRTLTHRTLPVFYDIAQMEPHAATAIVNHLNEKYTNRKYCSYRCGEYKIPFAISSSLHICEK